MPSYSHPFFLFRILLAPALVAFLYLYFYPGINDCAFPPATKNRTRCNSYGCQNSTVSAGKAPFRLLALADPQLEGDTSLPLGWNDGASANLQRLWSDVAAGRWDSLREDLPVLLQGYRKKLDLWGNDWYLAHIYRQTRWWAEPTHTVVLGDLLGSQWIGNEEFERRAERFWDRVFGTAERVPESVMAADHATEVLGMDKSWKRRIIAVAGNHDIGYAGDLDENRIERFENAFGKVNWNITFRLPNATLTGGENYLTTRDYFDGAGPQPELHLIMLNSMNLDEPTRSPALRDESLDFLRNTVCNSNRILQENGATVLLTHIPLHKPDGVCVDGPHFSYFSSEHGGGIHEQNHLSQNISELISRCLTGISKTPSVLLNGHDHEGCDTYHYHDQPWPLPSDPDGHDWSDRLDTHKVVRYSDYDSLNSFDRTNGLREITVRSMMGSYGGYAGFLSGWYNQDEGQWRFEYETCGFGVQHIWWVCNIVLLLEIGFGVVSGLDLLARKLLEPEKRDKVKKA